MSEFTYSDKIFENISGGSLVVGNSFMCHESPYRCNKTQTQM